MTPKQKIKQIILLVFGLSVAHLGVTFFIQANLGTDPFNVLVAGCIILALGMTIVIKSEAGTGPNDLVAIVISDKSHKPFGIVRILTDCFFVIAGFLLGGTFGLGTIICAFIVGPVAQIFMPYSQRFCKKIIGN